ncbi:uncharacterized protein CBL_08815 [Carabus blaptoides fortunei]
MSYLVQWFTEWSELQRTDFLPVLAEKMTNIAYVNGIVNSIAGVNCQDKPMSLFECRVKLFREWVSQWNAEQRERLMKRIAEVDPSFGEKLNSELQNGVEENGVEESDVGSIESQP